MDITPTNISTLNRASVTVWNRGAGSYKPHSAHLAAQTTAVAGKCVFGWLGAMPSLRPFVKEIEKASVASNKWEVTPEPWGVKWGIPRRDIKNDQFGQYSSMFEQNGLLSAVHPDQLLFQRLVAGFTEVDYTGAAFFAADKKHATGVSKNKFTNKFTKQLTPTYFGQALAGLGKIVAPDGAPFNAVRKLILVCGEDNRSAAEDITEIATLSGGGTNKYYKKADLIVTPFITGAHWFLLNMAMPFKPMIQGNEEKITFTANTNPLSEAVFNREEFEYKSYGILKLDYGLPQLAWGSTGADA